MARSHVEFIQSQQLPWESSAQAWPGAGAEVKRLSSDADTGACSLLVRLPAGWQRPAGAIAASEERYVLDGSLQLADRTLGPDGYARFPAYCARAAEAAPQGALLLVFLDAWPETATPRPGIEATIVDTFEMPWGCEGMDPAYGDAGMRWKILHHDETTQDTSMLVLTPAQLAPPGLRGPQERHDCVEEMFLISGDFLSPLGPMHTGAYFWRPPQILHGPFASRHGNVSFIRTLGDVLENNWSEHEVTLTRDAAPAPVVPPQVYPELRRWEPAGRY